MSAPARKTNALPDIAELESFLYDEADCLDRADLDDWIKLYTDDATYWMPQSPEQTDPETQISLFYDDRLLMEIRCLNFGSDLSPSMAYPVRGSHVIGNIRIGDFDAVSGECRVTSNFQAVLMYRGKQTLYAGRYTHDLVRSGDSWKIRHKRVDLINSDVPLKSLIIYL